MQTERPPESVEEEFWSRDAIYGVRGSSMVDSDAFRF